MEANFCLGDWEVYPTLNRLQRGPEVQRLEPKVMDLLVYLAHHPGEVQSRERLLQAVWPDAFVTDQVLTHAIAEIRKVLGDNPDAPAFIETVARRGYVLVAPVTRDVAHARHAVRVDNDEATALPPPAVSLRWNTKLWIGAAALLAVLVFSVLWYLSRGKGEAPGQPPLITPLTSLAGSEEAPKFSPDGRFVAFQWDGPARDNWDIYVKQLGSGGQIRITTDPAPERFPVWSPDGSEIAFVRFSGEVASIYWMPSLGGTEKKLCDLGAPSLILLEYRVPVLSWSPDGRWLAFAEKTSAQDPVRVQLLSLDTREKKPLTSPPHGTFGDFYPEFSPDGRHVAFMRTAVFGTCDLWTQPMSSAEATRISHESYLDVGKPAWTADGRELIFPAGHGANRLMRVASTGGTPAPVAGVGEGAGWPTISGTRMAYEQRWETAWNFWRMRGPHYGGTDRAAAPLMVSTRSDLKPDYSPDGKRVAFYSTRSGFWEVWVCESDGSKAVQLTSLRKGSGTPRWSPDGKRIAFDSRPGGDSEIYVVSVDGGTPRRMTQDKSDDIVPSWSRDERWIYFTSSRSGRREIWKMPSDGGKAVQITKGGGHNAWESFDGRFIYYSRPDQSRGTGPIWKVPSKGGEETLVLNREIPWINWTLTTDGIYFSNQTDNRYSIEFFSFGTGKTTSFFEDETADSRRWVAISPDGQWLLYGSQPPGNSDLMLVENFR